MIYKNLNIIVAMTAKSGAIGKNGLMLYHLPKDLKYFKNTTLNSTIVMGYTTYLSLPKRPLPNRKNIVITRKKIEIEGCIILGSVDAILDYAKNNSHETIFICGGASIYEQLLPYVNKLYITMIEENEYPDADRFFPYIDFKKWKKILDVPEQDTKNLNFTVWERI